MRTTSLFFLIVCPSLAFGQYIGNPGGRAFPLGDMDQLSFYGVGFAGLEAGYSEFDVDSEYLTTDGILSSTSKLREPYFAISGGGHFEGFEGEFRIGGVFPELNESSLDADPFEDSGGVIFGGSVRYGFSPVPPLRIGFGGQILYSWSEGETIVADGSILSMEDVELETWRGQIFGGMGLDLPVGSHATFSPYIGGGAEFIEGDLELDRWDDYYYYDDDEDIGDIEEASVGFGLVGFDIFFDRGFRLGAEARFNDAGWAATVSVGWRF